MAGVGAHENSRVQSNLFMKKLESTRLFAGGPDTQNLGGAAMVLRCGVKKLRFHLSPSGTIEDATYASGLEGRNLQIGSRHPASPDSNYRGTHR